MRSLVLAAGLNATLHVAGIALTLAALRPGSALVPVPERLAYLAPHPMGWALGWGVWMLCALSLVGFLASLQPYAESPHVASLGVTLCAAGAAIDLLCDTGQIVALPGLAGDPTSHAAFLVWERWLDAGGTVAANGLYSIAIALTSLSLGGRVPRYAWGLGLGTCAAGMAMVAGGLSDDMRRVEQAGAPLFVLFLLWTAAVTAALVRQARP